MKVFAAPPIEQASIVARSMALVRGLCLSQEARRVMSSFPFARLSCLPLPSLAVSTLNRASLGVAQFSEKTRLPPTVYKTMPRPRKGLVRCRGGSELEHRSLDHLVCWSTQSGTWSSPPSQHRLVEGVSARWCGVTTKRAAHMGPNRVGNGS